MKPMSDSEIKRSIANVKASLAVEGLNMKRRSIVYGAKYLKGELSSQEAIGEIKKYIMDKNRKLKK